MHDNGDCPPARFTFDVLTLHRVDYSDHFYRPADVSDTQPEQHASYNAAPRSVSP